MKIVTPDGPANYIRQYVNQLDEEEYEMFTGIILQPVKELICLVLLHIRLT